MLLLGVAVRKHVFFSEVASRSNVHLALSIGKRSLVFDIFLNNFLKFNLFLLFLLFGSHVFIDQSLLGCSSFFCLLLHSFLLQAQFRVVLNAEVLSHYCSSALQGSHLSCFLVLVDVVDITGPDTHRVEELLFLLGNIGMSISFLIHLFSLEFLNSFSFQIFIIFLFLVLSRKIYEVFLHNTIPLVFRHVQSFSWVFINNESTLKSVSLFVSSTSWLDDVESNSVTFPSTEVVGLRNSCWSAGSSHQTTRSSWLSPDRPGIVLLRITVDLLWGFNFTVSCLFNHVF